jgi:hypothetical protein
MTTRLRPHTNKRLYVDPAVRRDYSSPGRTCSTSTLLCAATTRHPATHALHQPRRAPRLLVSGRTRSTSTSPCTARLSASARRAARHAACRAARRLLRLAQAHRRLLRLRRASGYFGTSRGLSRRSSSTTSPHAGSSSSTPPTLRVRVPRHVVQPVTRLTIDYSVRRDFVLRPHWIYFSHTVCGDYLSRGNTGSTSSTPHAAMTSSSGHIASTIHLD